MRGQVQIFEVVNDDLIPFDQGGNMILDTWSESIVDVLTANPSVSGTAYSGLLDCSNYTVRAISYSKSASGFGYNAHGSDPITVSGRTLATPALYVVNTVNTSSYSGINNIPSYPNPHDTLLEILPSSLSSVMVTYGQNLNLTVLWQYVSSLSSIGASGGMQLGCYAPSGAGTNRFIGALFNSASSLIASGRLGPNSTEAIGFNSAGTAGTMDWRGFQKTTGAGAAAQGLVTSSNTGTDFFLTSTPSIAYIFLLTARHLDVAALYGGIQSVGLWAIDIERTLANGVYPPFTYDMINPKMEFKLLAKKVFIRNLCQIEDVGTTAGFNNHSNLTGTWVVYFA
jgi:hypothetical protein